MKTAILIGLFAGLALAVGLLVNSGVADVGHAIAVGGWTALLAVTALHLPSMALCGLAWRQTSCGTNNNSGLFILSRLVRDGAGSVISILPISGELAGMRALVCYGFTASDAIASVVVDITMELLSQLAFSIIGVTLLYWQDPHDPIIKTSIFGIVVAIPAVFGFMRVQRSGLLSWLEQLSFRLAEAQQWPAVRGVAKIEAAIRKLYVRRHRIWQAFLLHLVAWMAGAAETWAGLWFLGHPLAVWQVLAIESLVYAIRTVVFFVPAAVGVQEGSYVMLGAIFGLGSQVALAMSLLKRGRELLLAMPALVMWQILENRLLLRRRIVSGD
ncbi:MAG TPA: lysylphosphatidylglycerol synthase domain-containing protein [Gammaproteobacteria bacterium]|nr:lysylphosphatidylglycerol synthase domain-containing protein [Gammaproteobacteria bacterium]